MLPVSQGSEEWLNLGLTLVDSLDTLLLLNMTAEFEEARQWVATHMLLKQVGPPAWPHISDDHFFTHANPIFCCVYVECTY